MGCLQGLDKVSENEKKDNPVLSGQQGKMGITHSSDLKGQEEQILEKTAVWKELPEKNFHL